MPPVLSCVPSVILALREGTTKGMIRQKITITLPAEHVAAARRGRRGFAIGVRLHLAGSCPQETLMKNSPRPAADMLSEQMPDWMSQMRGEACERCSNRAHRTMDPR
jgi:hypothetical protein